MGPHHVQHTVRALTLPDEHLARQGVSSLRRSGERAMAHTGTAGAIPMKRCGRCASEARWDIVGAAEARQTLAQVRRRGARLGSGLRRAKSVRRVAILLWHVLRQRRPRGPWPCPDGVPRPGASFGR